MSTYPKSVQSIQVFDFQVYPVWEYTNDDDLDETAVRPVKCIPVEDLNGKIVGTRIELANGSWMWASICNVDVSDPQSTEQFLTVSVERYGKWFNLARYHDFDYAERGPNALSRFLGLSVDDVFPIRYDLTQYAIGNLAALVGEILKEPRQKLNQNELIALALRSGKKNTDST